MVLDNHQSEMAGGIFIAFFGIPGGKEGDITGHDRDNK